MARRSSPVGQARATRRPGHSKKLHRLQGQAEPLSLESACSSPSAGIDHINIINLGCGGYCHAERLQKARSASASRVADLRPGFEALHRRIILAMPIDALIDSLPDLVVRLRRDGTILAQGGGHG